MASDYFNTNQALETVLRYGSDLEDEEREDNDVLELQCSVQKKVTKTHAEKKTAKAKANDIVGAKPGEHAVEAATAHKALTSQIGAKPAKHTVEASTASNHKGSTPQSLQSRRRQRIARNKRKRNQRIKLHKKQSKRNKILCLKGLNEVLKSENDTLKEAKTKYMMMWNKAEQEKTKIKNSRNLLSRPATVTKSMLVSNSLMATDILELQHSMFSSQVQEEIIGQGRFGVCKIKTFRGTQVAVKEFKDLNISKTEVLNEAKILANLKHISLPILFGVITKGSPFCIVTQFYGINGKSVTLHSILSKKSFLCTFFKANVYRYLYQLTDAICYLHSKKVIHNDIKTDNVLVVEESGPVVEYAPVLIDFGKAKYAAATKIKKLSEREKKFYKKHHSHIAPEVIDGTHRPSVKSDVFSFGVIAKKLSCIVERNLDDICSCCLESVRERYDSSMVKELVHTYIA